MFLRCARNFPDSASTGVHGRMGWVWGRVVKSQRYRVLLRTSFMDEPSVHLHRAPCLVKCSAITVLKFLTISSISFHFTGPHKLCSLFLFIYFVFIYFLFSGIVYLCWCCALGWEAAAPDLQWSWELSEACQSWGSMAESPIYRNEAKPNPTI